MGWEFETEPEFQSKLDWADRFAREEIEPLDYVLGNEFDKDDERSNGVIWPLQQEVQRQGLWACHLGPDLGGQGYGQVKLALLNEVLGRSRWAPSVFGCQAPDSGNAEILAKYGTPEQKAQYLKPLLDGKISSCYSMTEPHAGADPSLFTTMARRDGDDWVINGEKWFSSNARYAKFFIVMAVTSEAESVYRGTSMFLVPAGTAGLEIVRNVGVGMEPEELGTHGYVRYNDVRVSGHYLLGTEGAGFEVAQTRLGGGRIHHAMRTIAQVQKALDMMCERALSRQARTGKLADFQLTQEKIADSWIELEQFRLLVIRAAWMIDKYNDYKKVRRHIAAVKVAMPKVFHDVVLRAMQLHGALGVSNEMPLAEMLTRAIIMGIADGPSEVHKLSIARELLRQYRPASGLWPTEHTPSRRAAAISRYTDIFEAAI